MQLVKSTKLKRQHVIWDCHIPFNSHTYTLCSIGKVSIAVVSEKLNGKRILAWTRNVKRKEGSIRSWRCCTIFTLIFSITKAKDINSHAFVLAYQHIQIARRYMISLETFISKKVASGGYHASQSIFLYMFEVEL